MENTESLNITLTYHQHPEKKGFFEIVVDGDPRYCVHTTIFGRDPLKNFTNCSSLDVLDQQFQDLEHRLAKGYAWKQLAISSHPVEKLRKKLEFKGISSTNIEKIIADCQRLGYLDDLQWAESYVAYQITRKNGPQLIKAKLYAHGISQDIIQQVIDGKNHEGSILRLLETRYKNRDLQDFRERQKVIAALIRKGFNKDDIDKTLASLSS